MEFGVSCSLLSLSVIGGFCVYVVWPGRSGWSGWLCAARWFRFIDLIPTVSFDLVWFYCI